MRSKTSCFNAAIFKKSYTRFWPLWAAYLALWILILPVILLSERRYYTDLASADTVRYILHIGYIGGILGGAFMGVAVAMAVWSFLYNARSAHGIACLPLRREGLFLSVALGGLVPAVAVHGIVAALTGLTGLALGALRDLGPVVQWFGLMTLLYLFYYGFATLCAMLTGSLIILPLVYGVLNFLVVGVEVLIKEIFSNFVYGLTSGLGGMSVSQYLSPPVGQLGNISVWSQVVAGQTEYHLRGWGLVWLYALAGVLLLGGALLLLRRRRMESAGDVVAVKVLKPIFRWCMALGSAMLLGSLLYTIFFYGWGSYTARFVFLCTLGFLLLGGFIGWFVGEMLLKKSFRVFHKRTWGGFGLVCVVILAVMVGMRLDVLGLVNRMPDPAKVECVSVNAMGNTGVLSTPEGVEQAQSVHRAILADRAYNEGEGDSRDGGGTVSSMEVRFTYVLKSGSAIQRCYRLSYPYDEPRSRGELGQVQDLLNSPDALRNRRFDETLRPVNVSGGTVYATVSLAEAAELSGYESAEAYLRDRGWFSREDWEIMSETERQQELTSVLLTEMVDAWMEDREIPEAAYRSDGSLRPFREIDPEKVYVRYVRGLSAAEAWRLYSEALGEDLDEGKLGRVYIFQDAAFARETYDASVELELRFEKEPLKGELESGKYYGYNEDGYYFSHFGTTLTVDAARTADWLSAELGISLRTPEQMKSE